MKPGIELLLKLSWMNFANLSDLKKEVIGPLEK